MHDKREPQATVDCRFSVREGEIQFQGSNVGLEAGRSQNWAGSAFMLLTAGKMVGGFVWPMIAARCSITGARRTLVPCISTAETLGRREVEKHSAD